MWDWQGWGRENACDRRGRLYELRVKRPSARTLHQLPHADLEVLIWPTPGWPTTRELTDYPDAAFEAYPLKELLRAAIRSSSELRTGSSV
jgi:hypothetical protein